MMLDVSKEGCFIVLIECVFKFVNVYVCIDLKEVVNLCDMLV